MAEKRQQFVHPEPIPLAQLGTRQRVRRQLAFLLLKLLNPFFDRLGHDELANEYVLCLAVSESQAIRSTLFTKARSLGLTYEHDRKLDPRVKGSTIGP